MTATIGEDVTTERLPPQDLTAEMCVLGGMLLSQHAIGDVLEILTAADFYRPAHATIYRTIVDLYTRGEPADALTVAAALADAGNLDRCGGGPYIHTLIETVPTASNAGYYAQIVKATSQDRHLIEAGTRIVQLGERQDRDPANPKSDQAARILFDAITDPGANDLIPVGDLMADVLAAIEAGQQPGLSTGNVDLDRLTAGMQPGQVWIVAGRPSMGKSVCITDFARAVALRQHLPVVFFSLEMSRRGLMNRILAAEAKVPLHRIKAGGHHLDQDEWDRIAHHSGELTEAPLFIDDTAGLRITDVAAKTRRRAARENLGLIVIDYLQLMEGVAGKGNESREREVARISRGLKVLASDLAVPIVVAAQLNRGPEQRSDKHPVMSDLRESGAIEANADVVILLHRDDYYDKESPRSGEADLIVAKNRDGDTDTITVASQLHFSRFVPMAPA